MQKPGSLPALRLALCLHYHPGDTGPSTEDLSPCPLPHGGPVVLPSCGEGYEAGATGGSALTFP